MHLSSFHCCGRNWNCIELFHRNGCRKSDTDLVIVFLLIIAVVALQAIEAVLDVLVNFHIYHRLTSHNMAIIHSVLGIFIPMYEAICLFIMSKKPYNPEMEPNLPPQAPNFGGNPIPPTMPVSPAASETPAESVSPMPAEAPVQQVPVTPTESSAQNPYVNPMQVQGTENLAKDAQSTEAEPTENSAEKIKRKGKISYRF